MPKQSSISWMNFIIQINTMMLINNFTLFIFNKKYKKQFKLS